MLDAHKAVSPVHVHHHNVPFREIQPVSFAVDVYGCVNYCVGEGVRHVHNGEKWLLWQAAFKITVLSGKLRLHILPGGIVEKVYGLKVKLDKEYQTQLKAGKGSLLSVDKKHRTLSEEGDAGLGANTRGGRIKELQKEASEINRQLEEASEAELPQVIERAKPIMAEYLIHNSDLYDKYGLPKGDNEKNLRKPMPWSAMETKIQKALEQPKFRDMQLSVKNVRSAMNTIINAEFEAKPVENSMPLVKAPNKGINNNPDAPVL